MRVPWGSLRGPIGYLQELQSPSALQRTLLYVRTRVSRKILRGEPKRGTEDASKNEMQGIQTPLLQHLYTVRSNLVGSKIHREFGKLA